MVYCFQYSYRKVVNDKHQALLVLGSPSGFVCVCVWSVGDIHEFQPGLLNFLCTWTNHAHLGVHTYPLRGFPHLMTWLPLASDSDLM